MILSNLILLFILGLNRIVCHLLVGFLTHLFDFAIPLVYPPIGINLTLTWYIIKGMIATFGELNTK